MEISTALNSLKDRMNVCLENGEISKVLTRLVEMRKELKMCSHYNDVNVIKYFEDTIERLRAELFEPDEIFWIKLYDAYEARS